MEMGTKSFGAEGPEEDRSRSRGDEAYANSTKTYDNSTSEYMRGVDDLYTGAFRSNMRRRGKSCKARG